MKSGVCIFWSVLLTSVLGAACKQSELTPISRNSRIQSFSQAKRMMKAIYRNHRKTLYCGCPFDSELNIELSKCAFQPEKPSKRIRRVEWEHVVPASILGRTSSAWKNGDPRCINSKGKAYRGRRCAKKVDPRARRMLSDLHNLFPAVGQLNNIRGNKPFGLLDGEVRAFGTCDFEIAFGRVEPATEIRGEIARTYLYMNAAYPNAFVMSDKQTGLFRRWSAADPPDAWECERERKISQIQGNSNPFTRAQCVREYP
ncbi:MAG: endonuclease [Myxococcota bacterium]|nr:endonuclease [Myxococcota bacterium]